LALRIATPLEPGARGDFLSPAGGKEQGEGAIFSLSSVHGEGGPFFQLKVLRFKTPDFLR